MRWGEIFRPIASFFLRRTTIHFMKPGDTIIISFDAPFHKGRIGKFLYLSVDGTIAVLSDPEKETQFGRTLFSVETKYIKVW